MDASFQGFDTSVYENKKESLLFFSPRVRSSIPVLEDLQLVQCEAKVSTIFCRAQLPEEELLLTEEKEILVQ